MVIQWMRTALFTSTLCVSTCMPPCTMAFYSYVMMKNVRVGIEAILHVVREQHDRSVTEMRTPCCLFDSASRETYGRINVPVFCWMFPCSKDTFMLIFQMMSDSHWSADLKTKKWSQTLSCVHLYLPPGASSFHCFQCLMHVVTAAVRRDGSGNICKTCHEQRKKRARRDQYRSLITNYEGGT